MGRLERARRSLELARNQFDYADLKVDADGVITATSAEPGQVVAVGQPVVRLAHRGEKEAVVALPESWLDEARKSKATVRLWSDPDRQFAARLRELASDRKEARVQGGNIAALVEQRHHDGEPPLRRSMPRGAASPGSLACHRLSVSGLLRPAAIYIAGGGRCRAARLGLMSQARLAGCAARGDRR